MDYKKEVAKLLNTACGIEVEEAYALIEMPPDEKMGDFAFPCFRSAKELKKAPQAISGEIAEKIKKNEMFSCIEQKGPYVNFFVEKGRFVSYVMKEVGTKGAEFGSSDIGRGGMVVIDYSSPNIAKPFHVGHLRSTVIGRALYNMYDFLGYKSYGINFLGDWGTQFGKLIVAYQKWGNKDEVDKKDIMELNRLYVKFHEEADKNPALEDEAREWLLKMQKGDEEALNLWRWFGEVSKKEYERIYGRLNCRFDSYKGESFYNDKMASIVEELKEKNLLKESEGAMIVDLEEYKMPPCLILRGDGGTLYPTRDIASAKYRKQEYNFVKALYLTAVDQTLHFKQWFKVIDLMGYDWAKDLIHVPFGMVVFEDGKLSTRHGKVIFLEALLDEAVSRAAAIIEEKNPGLENKEAVAEAVGIGALVFNDLYNNRIKDVLFSWDRMLNFEGESGPYMQYTHARCKSLLEKAGDIDFMDADLSKLTDEASFRLAKELYEYPAKIVEAVDKNEPFIVARHLMEIAQAFNKFYHDNPILQAEEEFKKARLYAVQCVGQILFTGLSLLGVPTPDKM